MWNEHELLEFLHDKTKYLFSIMNTMNNHAHNAQYCSS